MDLSKIVQNAGAGEPKQTRPNNAKWCNNAIQVKLPDEERWAFYEGFLQHLSDGTNVIAVNDIQEFNQVRERIKTLKLLFPHLQFRIVAIVEVF